MDPEKAPAPSSISERIKMVRKALDMSQRAFSQCLSLSHTYIGGVESGAREVNDRLVKLIVSEYGVNERWLRTGEGDIFEQNQDPEFAKAAELYKALPPKYRKVALKLIEALLDTPD